MICSVFSARQDPFRRRRDVGLVPAFGEGTGDGLVVHVGLLLGPSGIARRRAHPFGEGVVAGEPAEVLEHPRRAQEDPVVLLDRFVFLDQQGVDPAADLGELVQGLAQRADGGLELPAVDLRVFGGAEERLGVAASPSTGAGRVFAVDLAGRVVAFGA